MFKENNWKLVDSDCDMRTAMDADYFSSFSSIKINGKMIYDRG